MEKSDAEEWTQAQGQALAGSFRLVDLAIRLGVPLALGYSNPQAWVRERLGGYTRLAIEERREAHRELADQGLSQRDIAERTGVSHQTVMRDLGPSGPEPERFPLEDEIPPGPSGPKPHVSHNSGDNEWYTPSNIIEAARLAMGSIDLDPASSEIANTAVKASQYFTVADDGLSQQWKGNIWLNPPYARGLVADFTTKLLDELNEGATAACLLVNNATETEWWQEAAQNADAVCLLRGRVQYWQPGKGTSSPLQGQTVLIYNADWAPFERLGIVFR